MHTNIHNDIFTTIARAIVTTPENFAIHSRITKLLKHKQNIITQEHGIDWGIAEALAFGSLLVEGHNIRLSGQDVGRGTFSHRHSIIYDQTTKKTYIPLNNICPEQKQIDIIDSPLSEAAVLGFEFGYSTIDPNTLVLWEAQFGDFANGAQVIIDQFISSSEAKWEQLAGLVMLLPHGYEGQGPEHSSARLERFLQLCASNNMIVANCSTPANYFHILRRQIHAKFRKPLIIMTPKSLLRHKLAISNKSDFVDQKYFQPMLIT